MSRLAKEYMRVRLQEIDEASRGMPALRTRSGALRRLELSVPNLYDLPIQVTPGGQDPAKPIPFAAMQTFRGLLSIAGYSAAPGSLAARADGTGRKGDTLVGMRSAAIGAARAKGSIAVRSPMAGAAVGCAKGSGTAVVILQLSGAAIGVAKTQGTEGPVVNPLGPAIGCAKGSGAIAVRVFGAGAAVGVGSGAGAATLPPVLGGAAIGVAKGRGTAAVRVFGAGAAIGCAVGSGTMQGAGTVLKLSGRVVGCAVTRGRMQNTLAA